jgi:hypothetical protein
MEKDIGMRRIKLGSSVVAERSHPALFKAMVQILLDNGCVNRLEPMPSMFEIPHSWAGQVGEVEHALSGLGEEELTEFCVGEQGDVENEFLNDPGLRKANDFLDAFFNEWT